jgi:monofunctional biosynthetic peptidoglycan transglycosylase
VTKSRRKPGRRIPAWIRIPVLILLGLHAFWAVCLLGLRFINPITTGVQTQRRLEALFSWTDYTKRSTFVPLERISTHLQHAVIAAEDGRFYQHSGIDWQQVELVMQESLEEGEIPRGASTITQQLVKNLFFTTHRNPLRKVFEYTLAPMASFILGKRRVSELYLNIVEWGPGIWGAEAAAQYHFNLHANRLSRDQSSRLAACLPNPRRRRPAAMNRYSGIIETRMDQLGW